MSTRQERIFVAGHRGMAGSAIVRALAAAGGTQVVTRTRQELDLENQDEVQRFFAAENFDTVYVAAAKVGGILANFTYPADFLYRNLVIETNVIHGAYSAGVKKLLFLGSSCIYPKHAPQPMREDALLTGPLEPTNEAYAIAKIAGLKLCEAYQRQYGVQYVCAMPTNLYGENDNYNLQSSHVLPALIRKFHEGKVGGQAQVMLWGSGTPRREFLYVDDLAQACLALMNSPDASGLYNVGAERDITIAELAAIVAEIVGYQGRIVYDASKPDGTPQKLLDCSRMRALGWQPSLTLREGIALTYRHYRASLAAACRPIAGALPVA